MVSNKKDSVDPQAKVSPPRGWAQVKEAAAYAGVGKTVLRGWLKAGLRHSRIGKKLILISYSAIDEFLDRFAKSTTQDELAKAAKEAASRIFR